MFNNGRISRRNDQGGASMNRLILGRYFPGESCLHQLDPRSKLVSAISLIIILFIADNWQGYILLWLCTITIMFLSGVPFKVYIRGVRPMIWLIMFTVLLQMLFTSGSIIYFKWGPIVLSQYGMINGIYIFSRFVMIIFITTVVTLTTKPIDLTDGINGLLRPLRYIKVPVDDLSFMLSISLRFIPNLLDETQKVMDAQRARGTQFGEGNLFKQMKTLVPILLPLFSHSLQRAEDLANVMEVKGYQSGKKRSSFRQLSWKIQDSLCLLIILSLTLLLIFINSLN